MTARPQAQEPGAGVRVHDRPLLRPDDEIEGNRAIVEVERPALLEANQEPTAVAVHEQGALAGLEGKAHRTP